jgi:4-amino-4-deoxy-L-arabinose transferase-like glycosyltransferase
MVQRIVRLWQFQSPTRIDWFVYFIAFVIIQIPAIYNFYSNDGAHNAYTLFAQSLLNGSIELPQMSSYGDMIQYNGEHYLPYPPLPSILLMPFVAILGASQVNTVAIATLMACASLYLLYRIFFKLQVKQEYYPWLLLGFFFGSGYWYALFTSHHVYAFAHITSCLFQLLFLNEILGKRRWWLIGVFIGCSFLTRQFTVFYVVLAVGYMAYLHKSGKEIFRMKNFLGLCASLGFFAGLYLLYNYLRFGNPLETGYQHILFIGVLKDRVDQYGVFSARYFLFNFYSFFLKGFNIEFEGHGLLKIKDMDLWGTSLLGASPFLIASLRANWAKPLKVFSWGTIILILTGSLFYHNNGFHQINTSRFSLDFLPLLFVLTALGINSLPRWLFRGMIVYAVLLNVVAFAIHLIYQ